MIGEILYIFDGNVRVYQDDTGNRISAVNKKYCFVPFIVTGESKQSWIANYHGKEVRFNKSNLRVDGAYRSPAMDNCGYTEQDMIDYLWRDQHQRGIIEAIQSCKNVDKLKRIAAILAE